MNNTLQSFLQDQLQALRDQHLYKPLLTVESAPGARVTVKGRDLREYFERLLAAIRRRPWVRTALDGVNVVAVALMAGVAAQLARTALVDPLTVALAAATLGALLRWRPNPTWLIAAGAAAGLLHGWV